MVKFKTKDVSKGTSYEESTLNGPKISNEGTKNNCRPPLLNSSQQLLMKTLPFR